ncbi:MAG: hypothetical protein LBG43_02000 [Treponema sp.]|jgi:hypothetical protein|nr:hypothetical protein [Treponema sp.]
MKKVIALIVIMAIFSTTAFAAPLSVAGSSDALSAETSLSSQSDVDLFADVHVAALTPEQAQAVEGAGPFGAILGGIVGLVTTVITTVNYVNNNAINYKTPAGIYDITICALSNALIWGGLYTSAGAGLIPF